jgi:hypothetical protein
MDIENLSYEYLKEFFNKYVDKEDINSYYFCRECRKMQDLNLLNVFYSDDDDIQTIEEEKFRNSITFIERDYICNKYNGYCTKDTRFNKEQVQFNEKNIEDLSDNEIINIMNKYISEHEYLEYVYCKLCRIIRVVYINEIEFIVKGGIKYSPDCCSRCYNYYPECCIDYYKFPLSENKEDLCIKCDNEINPVNLKPAK